MHSFAPLFLSNLFSGDMILILFVALILFGGDKLPEIARGLGKGIRDFKDATEGVKREINNQINSYEEKRTEEALNKQAEAIQNQVTAHSDASSQSRPPVENTMPVSDYGFTGYEGGGAAGSHPDAGGEPASEDDADLQHTNSGHSQ